MRNPTVPYTLHTLEALTISKSGAREKIPFAALERHLSYFEIDEVAATPGVRLAQRTRLWGTEANEISAAGMYDPHPNLRDQAQLNR
jgi:hypothetical protein